MSCQLAIFDLDGTILNTLDDLTNAVNYAMRQCGLPELGRMAVREFLGNGMKYLIHHSVPGGTAADVEEKAFDLFCSYYADHCSINTRPYDGIFQLMDHLHENGCKTAVVSNKGDFAVQTLIKQYFPDCFSIAVGEREKEGIRRKPAPDTVNAVLRELGIDRENAVYIGDSEVDLATANNANMRHILVTWGFRDRSFLIEKGGKTIVDTMQELEEKILRG
ncbi:MAG: HAD family hydrolase [Eubacterium sp.]